MAASRRPPSLTLSLALLAAIPAAAQVAGTLSGSVIDPSGAVVPGATVGIYMPGGKKPLLTGKTNGAGIFSFIAVQPDRYEVTIEATASPSAKIGNVKVEPVQETSLGAIKME